MGQCGIQGPDTHCVSDTLIGEMCGCAWRIGGRVIQRKGQRSSEGMNLMALTPPLFGGHTHTPPPLPTAHVCAPRPKPLRNAVHYLFSFQSKFSRAPFRARTQTHTLACTQKHVLAGSSLELQKQSERVPMSANALPA